MNTIINDDVSKSSLSPKPVTHKSNEDKDMEYEYMIVKPENETYVEKTPNVTEHFENDNNLWATINTLNSKINRANEQLKLVMDSDSSLDDFKRSDLIEQQIRDDKLYILKQREQNSKLENINKLMRDIEALKSKAVNSIAQIRKIKSLDNGVTLNVNMVDKKNMSISLNKGCLQYVSDNITNGYGVVECNPTDTTQMFNATYNKSSNPSTHSYSITPASKYNRCLTANLDGSKVNISIEECNNTAGTQMWSLS